MFRSISAAAAVCCSTAAAMVAWSSLIWPTVCSIRAIAWTAWVDAGHDADRVVGAARGLLGAPSAVAAAGRPRAGR
jgi:hypothetical protein